MQAELESRVWDALRQVIDPEIGLNVVDLGLVYGVEGEGPVVRVQITMTTPACPLSEQIVRDAEARLGEVEGIETADVELVWSPLWTPKRMSEHAQEVLGWSS